MNITLPNPRPPSVPLSTSCRSRVRWVKGCGGWERVGGREGGNEERGGKGTQVMHDRRHITIDPEARMHPYNAGTKYGRTYATENVYPCMRWSHDRRDPRISALPMPGRRGRGGVQLILRHLGQKPDSLPHGLCRSFRADVFLVLMDLARVTACKPYITCMPHSHRYPWLGSLYKYYGERKLAKRARASRSRVSMLQIPAQQVGINRVSSVDRDSSDA